MAIIDRCPRCLAATLECQPKPRHRRFCLQPLIEGISRTFGALRRALARGAR